MLGGSRACHIGPTCYSMPLPWRVQNGFETPPWRKQGVVEETHDQNAIAHHTSSEADRGNRPSKRELMEIGTCRDRKGRTDAFRDERSMHGIQVQLSWHEFSQFTSSQGLDKPLPSRSRRAYSATTTASSVHACDVSTRRGICPRGALCSTLAQDFVNPRFSSCAQQPFQRGQLVP